MAGGKEETPDDVGLTQPLAGQDPSSINVWSAGWEGAQESRDHPQGTQDHPGCTTD